MARAATVKDDYAEIAREQEAFDRLLPDLLVEHEGEFALFHNTQPVGFFQIYEEAYRAGLEQFGPDETFLVSEVKLRKSDVTSYAWGAGVMFTR